MKKINHQNWCPLAFFLQEFTWFFASNSHGIYNKDDFAEINNESSIESDLTSTSRYGIISEGNSATINNSGNITSNKYAIYNSGTNVTINNSGDLTGGVRLGNATLNILGGTISGEIDGNDYLGNLVISASNFNQENDFSDLNNLTIQDNGILNSYFEISANTIEIADGATFVINEGSNIIAPIQGLADESGNLEINSDFSSDFAIGQSGNSLANINVNSGNIFAISSDIYSVNINVFGTFDSSSENNQTINGNVTVGNSGIFYIGNNSQIISGNLELEENSILQVSLKNQDVGNLTIGEKATIDSSQNTQYIANNTSYGLIIASDLSEINKISNSNITVDNSNSNLLGLLEFSTKISDNGLALNISRIDSGQFSQSDNIKNIYNNLNEISDSSDGNLLSFQKYLNSNAVSTTNAETIIEQIAPFPLKAILNTSLLNISAMANLSEDRLLNYENVEKKHEALWIKTFGQKTSQDKIKSDVEFSLKTTGIIAGIDKEISTDFILGFAISYLHSNIKTANGLQNNVISSYQTEVYTRKYFDDYFFDNFAGISLNKFNQKRSIEAIGEDATSSYFGQNFLLKSKFGKKINLENNFILTPHTSLKYVFNNLPSYKEKGADELNLNVSSITANFLESSIGADIGWQTTLPKIEYNDFKFSHLTSLLNISYSHFLIADKPTLKAKLQNQTTGFDYKISQIDKSRLDLGFLISLYNEYDAVFNLNLKRSVRKTSQTNFVGIDFVQRF